MDDLAPASREEAKGESPSNPVIRALKKHLTAVRAKVTGTDELRTNICSYIWGMTILKSPPSLWITINPADIHDPIAQVFAGEEINLDNFDCNVGPDASHHATTIARDPYAGANFFHFAPFGFLVKVGIFGTVEGYIGTVEAQG
ncbi:hypothetical protein C8R48DRAFT_745923 [Suillus tomentosus]|nr:hypothetical protein C8R48DRAFT_745923 [Suillus tomentosus]